MKKRLISFFIIVALILATVVIVHAGPSYPIPPPVPHSQPLCPADCVCDDCDVEVDKYRTP